MARLGFLPLVLIGSGALVAAVGCGAGRRDVVEAPVDLAIAPVGALPAGQPLLVTSSERSRDGSCNVRLSAKRIDKSSPGCFLDEEITHGPGDLRFPCSGDGTAEADFGQQHYRGTIEKGKVELELTTELDWQDGCRWGTTARIRGPVLDASGEPTLKKLTWEYRDHVISGKSCSGVCTASAAFDVTSTRARPVTPPSGRPGDDDEEPDP